ncbi:hypothetical protein RvY_12489 [Ramazzottius varieornatus]|uniref:Uncharacterized protein n=1 Tax=Ramazzottius varieornatus TaxID=947166 RepID=A0A1D1VJN8_RAMVA|nr:hypothetical protein RvY_12489 [Ramazzottius varieornatus]
MEERKSITKRLATKLDRRVSELAMNSNEPVRHDREMKELVRLNQGPRPLYQIYEAKKTDNKDVDELNTFYSNKLYDLLSFTGKADLLKTETAVRSTDHCSYKPTRDMTMKEFLARMRDPDFDDLVVTGTNDPEHNVELSHRRSTEDTDGIADTLQDRDLHDGYYKNPLSDVFQPDDGQMSYGWYEEPAEPSTFPRLLVEAGNPDDVSITRKPEELCILVKLFSEPNRIPAVTLLLLRNTGKEPFEFGLLPVEYPADTLWSDEKSGLIYFIEGSGVLEGGDRHQLTVVFECHHQGTFAETYRLWVQPKHTKCPKSIILIVQGRSCPEKILTFPLETFQPMDIDNDKFHRDEDEKLDDHITESLWKLAERKGHCSQASIEDQFREANHVELQSAPATRLQYLWLFSHLDYRDIPWYDNIIEREKQAQSQLPGEINKRLLKDLSEAQRKLTHAQTVRPDWVDQEVPKEDKGVFWRQAGSVYKCPVHDQDLPLPGNVQHFTHTTSQIHVMQTNPNLQIFSHTDNNSAQATTAANANVTLNKGKSERTTGTPKKQSSKSQSDNFAKKAQNSGRSSKEKSLIKAEVFDTDWVPMIVQTDDVATDLEKRLGSMPKTDGKGQTVTKKKPYELNPDVGQPEKSIPGLIDQDKIANKAVMDARWLRHCLDQDWVRNAVSYVLLEKADKVKKQGETVPNPTEDQINDNDFLRDFPQWDWSINALRCAIQQSTHNIYIKLGLTREIAKVEASLNSTIKPKVPLNFTADEKTEELLTSTVEYVLKRGENYARGLARYLEKCYADTKPTEPPPSEELVKAREKVRAMEDTLNSPSARSAAARAARKAHKNSESDSEGGSSGKGGSRPVTRESGDKSMLRTSKSNVPMSAASTKASTVASSNNVKDGGGKDASKKGGNAHGPNGEMEKKSAEKEARINLAILEADYERQMETYQDEVNAHDRWRDDQLLEMNKQISAFVNGLWNKEVELLFERIQKPVDQLKLEEEIKEEEWRRDQLERRRANTLTTLYARLSAENSEVPLAVAGWRSCLTDMLVREDEGAEETWKEEWNLRKKEVKIFIKERPDERCKLAVRNIWRAPFEYQMEAQREELLPLRGKKNIQVSEDKAESSAQAPSTLSGKRDDLNAPKSASTNRKISVRSAAKHRTQTPTGADASASKINLEAQPKMVKIPPTKEELAAMKVVTGLRTALGDAWLEHRKAEESEHDSGDEWETEHEEVLDPWMYKPVNEETRQKLPKDFKFVSYKEPVQPEGVPKTKSKKPRGEGIWEEEPSSSSDDDEEINWNVVPNRGTKL